MKCVRCDRPFNSYEQDSGLPMPIIFGMKSAHERVFFACQKCVRETMEEYVIKKLEIDALKAS